MLEKSPRNIDTEKLRTILLLEADFSALNKIICNTRLMSKLERIKTIAYEIIGSHRSQVSIHLAINKKLLVDILN